MGLSIFYEFGLPAAQGAHFKHKLAQPEEESLIGRVIRDILEHPEGQNVHMGQDLKTMVRRTLY